MTSLSHIAEALAADVALTLAGHSAEIQALALEVYDGLVEELLVARGLDRAAAASLAAATGRRIRSRLAAVSVGSGDGAGRA